MRMNSLRILLLLFLITGVTAQITISGDARVRPRWDVTDKGDYGLNTKDFYYFYWVRLDIGADIGDGYYFKTRLGHNGAGSFIGKFGTGELPSSVSYSSAGRGGVDFLLAYFGHKGKKMSWAAGLLPINGDLFLDGHFYPIKPLDIPWILFNNSAAHGFDFSYKLLGSDLNLKLLVDNNDGILVEGDVVTVNDTLYNWIIDQSDGTIVRDTAYTSLSTDPNQDTRDQYTLYFAYPFKALGMSMTPQLYKTFADSGDSAPMTFGAELTLPRIAGFVFSGSVGQVIQNVATENFPGAYAGSISRLKFSGKVGPGTLLTWFDTFNLNPELEAFPKIYSSSIWLSYKLVMHKSPAGEFSLKPTYRQLVQQIDRIEDQRRVFLELTTEMKF